MLIFWKTLIQPTLNYCSQLRSPRKQGDTQKLQVQRTFTKPIKGMKELNYWQYLKQLGFYSQDRREKYRIIYVWKIL